jgi:hypothetical protein
MHGVDRDHERTNDALPGILAEKIIRVFRPKDILESYFQEEFILWPFGLLMPVNRKIATLGFLWPKIGSGSPSI